MENNKEILFYGYNDSKALYVHTIVRLGIPTLITVIMAGLFTILSFLIHEYYILVIWILPGIFILATILDFCMIKYNDKVFLRDVKKKHAFKIENGMFFKNEKCININDLRIYKFKKFIFIEFWESFCRVPNEEFVGITRDEFLSLFTINKFTHSAKLVKKYKCPCCGYYTLDYKGMYDICPVCFWEDNNEFDDPNEYDDCNKMSLNEARKNYLEFGASKKSMKKYCRKPRKSEMNG